MSNLPVKMNPAVPAFLQNTALWDVGADASAGLGGGAPPRISYRAGRFRFVSGDGVVTDSTESNGVALDVIVVGANPVVSKLYYAKAYDPAGDENEQPTCYSDNGPVAPATTPPQRPSARAQVPQAALCRSCPHDAWGSKVTPTGSQVKACSDLKKLAVVPVANLDGSAYLLTIPAASLKGWKAVVAELVKRGCPVGAFVFRVQFDTTASYPKLQFVPQRWVSETEVKAIEDLIGSDDVRALVGADDEAAVPKLLDAATAVGIVHAQRPQPVPAALVVVPPAQPMPTTQAPPPGMPPHTEAALATPPRRRGRPAKVEAPPPAAAQQSDPLEIPAFLRRPAAPAAQPVVQAADNEMDALLDGIMGKA